MNGFLVAGTASGVGKTTVSLAVLAALRLRGLQVQPFKGGPDFLDTGHLSRISGRTARNVDTWMLSPEANREVVWASSRDADAILIEGMMGLFDGKSGDSDVGSSAEIAKLLKLPVVLVLDAGKSARSIAAVVLGFQLFDPELNLAGVILNRLASAHHFAMLQSAITTACRTPILGWLPREASIAIPEQHLGLRTAEEVTTDEGAHDALNDLAALAERYFDLESLTNLTCGLEDTHAFSVPSFEYEPVRVGVARDAAFSFYYEDNLDLLREQGAEIVPFSPLQDAEMPPDLDALYLGGGYPELHAEQLSANTRMLTAVRTFAMSGRPVYAECGGMIYLGEELNTNDDVHHSLARVLPIRAEMTSKLVQFGYVTVELTRDCLIGSVGTIMRGHSFHYSRLSNATEAQTNYRVQYSLSGNQEAEDFSVGNVLGSYIHLHFRAAPAIAERFVQAARQARTAQLVSE